MGAPNDTADFQIVSQNCSGASLPAGNPNAAPAIPRGSCVVNVGFRPTKTNYTSVARLLFTSGSDNATESVLLAARSTGDAIGTVGGNVPSVLQLSVGPAGSFGTFVPGLAQAYTTALAASALATTGDATLSVTDPSTTAPGHLVNGTFSLPSALTARAVGLGDSASTPYRAAPRDRRSAARAQELEHADRGHPADARLPPVDRGERRAAGRHVQQVPDVHAVDHDPVS